MFIANGDIGRFINKNTSPLEHGNWLFDRLGDYSSRNTGFCSILLHLYHNTRCFSYIYVFIVIKNRAEESSKKGCWIKMKNIGAKILSIICFILAIINIYVLFTLIAPHPLDCVQPWFVINTMVLIFSGVMIFILSENKGWIKNGKRTTSCINMS